MPGRRSHVGNLRDEELSRRQPGRGRSATKALHRPNSIGEPPLRPRMVTPVEFEAAIFEEDGDRPGAYSPCREPGGSIASE